MNSFWVDLGPVCDCKRDDRGGPDLRAWVEFVLSLMVAVRGGSGGSSSDHPLQVSVGKKCVCRGELTHRVVHSDSWCG